MSSEEIIFGLAENQKELFRKNDSVWFECLVTGLVIRKIMTDAYKFLVKTNRVEAIGMISTEDKNMLWEKAKEIIKGRLGKEKCIEVAKSIYALGYFL
jgi:hypothetical protein